MSYVSIIYLIIDFYFRLDIENVSVLPGPSVPAPPADDVSEDNAELRRNLPPSPEGRHLFRARPQSCTVNFQSAARVLLRQSHLQSRAGNKPSRSLKFHNHGEGP